MSREIRADGDRWKIRLSADPPASGTRALVFFPVTSDQRPFRVVEVPEERVGGDEALAALSERELRELFDEASSMGYPRGYA